MDRVPDPPIGIHGVFPLFVFTLHLCAPVHLYILKTHLSDTVWSAKFTRVMEGKPPTTPPRDAAWPPTPPQSGTSRDPHQPGLFLAHDNESPTPCPQDRDTSPPTVLNYFEVLEEASKMSKLPTTITAHEPPIVIPLRPVFRGFRTSVMSTNGEARDASEQAEPHYASSHKSVPGPTEEIKELSNAKHQRSVSVLTDDLHELRVHHKPNLKRPRGVESEVDNRSHRDDDDDVVCTAAKSARPDGRFRLAKRPRPRALTPVAERQKSSGASSLIEVEDDEEERGANPALEVDGGPRRLQGSGSNTLGPEVHGRILRESLENSVD